MNSKYVLIAGILILGFAVGLGISNYFNQGSDYCTSIEEQIRKNQSFNGSLACYPPGVIEVNLSENVENTSDLKCVCRIIDRSGVRLFPITVSNQ